MAYVQNTDNNGLVVCQCEDVAGTAFTNVKATAGNAMYVSVQDMEGDVAHGAADSGAPMKVGATATAAKAANVHEADRVQLSADLAGQVRTIMPDYSAALDAAAPTSALMIAGKGNAAKPSADDEGDIVALSCDLSGQARVIAPDVTAALDAAVPGSALLLGGKGNAAKPTADDEGDIIALSTDLQGQVRVIAPDLSAALDAAIPANALLLGGKGNAAAPTADDEGDIIAISTDLQGAQRMIGNVAHDAADAGEPVKIGGYGKAAAPTAANADGDRVNGWFDLSGRQTVWNDQTYGTAAAAKPAGMTMVGGNDGTNCYALKTDTSGNLQVEALATPYDATVAAAVPVVGAAIALTDGTNARLMKGDSSGVAYVQGSVAHDAADGGNPVKAGAKASAALQAAVTEGDISNLSTDLYGQLRVMKQGKSVELKALAAQTESANGTAVTGLDPFTHLEVLLNCTVADTDAGDTLDVYVDASPDGGTTWINIIHFTQIVGTDSAIKLMAAVHLAANVTDVDVTSDLAAHAAPRSFLGNALRYRSVIVDAGGDDASFTYSVLAVLKQA